MKTEQIYIRVLPETKSLWVSAAESLGISLTAYITMMVNKATNPPPFNHEKKEK